MAKGQPTKPSVKAKAALEAIKADKTINAIASSLGVHPNQVSVWKKQLLEEASSIFEDKRKRATAAASSESELYEQIGRLKMELEWLKKKLS